MGYMLCIYGMSEGYIQQYIPETEVFSAEAGKFPRAACGARGIFPDSDEKIRGWGGYIVVYSPIKPNIYNIYPSFFLFHFCDYLSNENTALVRLGLDSF